MSIAQAKKAVKAAKAALEQAEANLHFARLPKASQRAAIAMDVIKQVRSGKLVVKNMVYVRGPIVHNDDDSTLLDGCEVCALGSIFACGLQKSMGLSLRGAAASDLEHECEVGFNVTLDDEVVREQLRPYFSLKQLYMIETAFEYTYDYFNFHRASDGLDDQEIEVARAFGRKYMSPKKRLIAIMQNIVDNNGTFVP